ncbi:conserved hypothetical protein [Afipia carboxidovorans OM5]|uniref:Polyhydroxyalkanoic acid synthase n=1 Tax=Afipia carboxidovorans (strain ATCC 49405 / DSM 1227 / KCTC 32145 / OM5) TaxID=504832 RepID=B6JID3_AFIC5|nr:polyhydroxyalkanoic acid system family protein [Afipia carboxidovorans]ACI94177.1 conserved hypothetical protein [Afipia carboxidovorans OM5]AEI02171.1 hypothetical protein OCA4_c10280 [Afipia carboxidovorans OM4]AEI05747.1 hypothetical protein OCA5_c10280 [Afipia carboxidovorans OM5]BEV46530.1 hypothetical protein CRBSH125_27130 [Afipia carboxidovorans]
MSKPLVVSIPHSLGREEAIRRLKNGLSGARTQYSQYLTVNEETWDENQLAFRVTALKQAVSGTIDVAEDHVRLEVVLPWLLAKLADGAQTLIRDKGRLMLEKK